MKNKLPPLTESLGTLINLGESDRLNLHLLELLAAKDPAATARLLALAATPGRSAMRQVTSLSAALRALGANAVYSILFATWGVEAIPCRAECLPARAFLVSHTFRICHMAMRLLRYADDMHVDPERLRLVALFANIGMARALSDAGSERARQRMMANAENDVHLWLDEPDFQEVLSEIPALATSWGAPAEVVAELEQLSVRARPDQPMSDISRLICMAEVSCQPSIEAIAEACAVCRRCGSSEKIIGVSMPLYGMAGAN